MTDARLVRISKLMSLILRHKPEQFAVMLDPEGYTTIDDIVRAMRDSLPDVCAEDVHRVVQLIEPDKARFSIEGPDIRANYGHSLSQRIAQQREAPPGILLHGTSEKALPIIRREGIHPMRRQYVHLTTNRELASRVGGRHGKAHFLEVDALRASKAGITFYRANESFWLTDCVAPEFIL
jgi:putative RNA 2'-phosphotransferase